MFCLITLFFLFNLVNEHRLRAAGRPDMCNYIDERVCQWSPASSLHYIYLVNFDCQESNEFIRLVQGADLIIFSLVEGDINW
jgi:hypothetical protein